MICKMPYSWLLVIAYSFRLKSGNYPLIFHVIDSKVKHEKRFKVIWGWREVHINLLKANIPSSFKVHFYFSWKQTWRWMKVIKVHLKVNWEKQIDKHMWKCPFSSNSSLQYHISIQLVNKWIVEESIIAMLGKIVGKYKSIRADYLSRSPRAKWILVWKFGNFLLT